MNIRRKIAGAAYSLCALASIILGTIYLVRREFMAYHSQAVGLEWAEVSLGMQALLGALMNVVGSAWIAIGAMTLVLIAIPFRRGDRWARWTVPAVLIGLYTSILAVTLHVEAATGAATPWHANAFAVLVAFIALLSDRPWTKEARTN